MASSGESKVLPGSASPALSFAEVLSLLEARRTDSAATDEAPSGSGGPDVECLLEEYLLRRGAGETLRSVRACAASDGVGVDIHGGGAGGGAGGGKVSVGAGPGADAAPMQKLEAFVGELQSRHGLRGP